MCVRKYKGLIFLMVMIMAMLSCMSVSASSMVYSSWEWSNSRSPIGTVGDTLFLENEVEVVRSIGGVTDTHYIKGTATLVKNNVDPYCYVKISGVWYVHLAGIRTDNSYGTTGWYKESDVITSAGLDKVEGYMVYKNKGVTNQGISVVGDVTKSVYSATASNLIKHSSTELKYHKVTSGSTLGSSGLYNPSTLGLEKIGYGVIAWANVDASGKIYGTYDFSSSYEVDNFVTSTGTKLKDSQEGAYIYLEPVWEYQNEAPVITGGDIHIYANSEWDELRLLEDVKAIDKEDGDLTKDMVIINSSILKEMLVSFATEEVGGVREFQLNLQVED